MVSHRRRRAILTAIVLYAFAALYIGYFGVNAFTGRHGLRAQQDLEQQLAAMQHELGEVKAEHALWERRVALLRTDAIDPDMLDEYDFSSGIRGKYAKCYAEGTNVVVLAPDVAAMFPDSQSVNDALRALVRIARRNGRRTQA